MTRRRNGLSPDDWHVTLTAMRPGYDGLVKICTTHKSKSTPYLLASQMIDQMNDLAKLHGRPNVYYFRREPHSTHNG